MEELLDIDALLIREREFHSFRVGYARENCYRLVRKSLQVVFDWLFPWRVFMSGNRRLSDTDFIDINYSIALF